MKGSEREAWRRGGGARGRLGRLEDTAPDGIFGRVQSDEEEAWLEKIRMWSAAREDCLWIEKLESGRNGRVAGVVSGLRLDPVSRIIEATISD
jgi:hypothetical protein